MFKRIRDLLKKKGGFTLIELLVVIAILGVIALIAVPNVVSALDNAKKNTDKTNAAAIATAITTARAADVGPADTGVTEFTEANFTSVVTEYLQSVPTVKNKSSENKNFYVTITAGKVIVYAKVGSNAVIGTDYIEIYPTPSGNWALN